MQHMFCLKCHCLASSTLSVGLLLAWRPWVITKASLKREPTLLLATAECCGDLCHQEDHISWGRAATKAAPERTFHVSLSLMSYCCAGMLQLQHLSMEGCDQIGARGLAYLAPLINLQYLNLELCSRACGLRHLSGGAGCCCSLPVVRTVLVVHSKANFVQPA